ncbi:MAG: hypothetical protein NC429_00915 [Lachnospiraceae bacterium]|nr:hypothetical protein [Lachnospiraceae bacterium]
MLKNINLKSKKTLLLGGAMLPAIILCIVLAVKVSANKADEKEPKAYDYTEAEQKLADEVKAYLAQYLELPDETSGEIADAAVENYNIVLDSDTDVINDEITDAVRKRIRSTIFALYEQPETLSDETLDALSSGVTEIIWNAVLSVLQSASAETAVTEEYAEEYEYLIQSLQSQIDALKERKMKVSINANIHDKTDSDVSGEDILAGISSMSEQELTELAEKLGLSAGQLRELWEASMSKSNEDLSDDMNEKLEKELDALRKELEKEISTTAGKEGTAGKTGQKGEKGEKGADGKTGNDGKTTYIAYADDAYGTNFSLTPTETAKYVGTCITSAAQQPADYSQYSNWQEYRAYIITATTDPDTGVTTVHIN